MNKIPQYEYTTSHSFLRSLEEFNVNSQSTDIITNPDPSSLVSVKLRGSTELGYYYITLFFGTPIQRQTLIVDTGSSITTIPCKECGDNCGNNHFNTPFDKDLSQSFQEFDCDEKFGRYTCSDCTGKCYFSIGYAEGSSYTGNYKKDFIVFGNEVEDYFDMIKNQNKNLEEVPEAFDQNEEEINRRAKQSQLEAIVEQRKTFMPFGCIKKETKLFYDQQADGIFGLGIGTNTRGSPPNLMDVIEMNNKNISKAFSICYAPNGGYLTFGGLNTAYHYPEENIQYVPYHDEYHQYRVRMAKIEIDGQDIGLSVKELNHGEGAFFDSGTTLTHVPSLTYNALVGGLKNFCLKNSKNCGRNDASAFSKFCWKYDPELYPNVSDFFATFPTFQFYFGVDAQAKYEWKPEDYLYNQERYKTRYCLGLSKYERETILGGTFMKNHDILFDKNRKLLGFTRANCGALFGVPMNNDNPSKKTDLNDPNTKLPLDTPGIEVDVNENEKNEQLIKAAILIVIGALIAGTFCVYTLIRKRAKYNSMENEAQGKELKHRTDESSHVGAVNGDGSPYQTVGSKNNFPDYEV